MSYKEEVALESVLNLSECQKNIIRVADPRGVGVCANCLAESVGFYDDVYISKCNIINTCNEYCPRMKRKF